MTVKLSPIGNDAPFVDSSGNPLSGGLLYTYTAGSSTPENTYTTSAGSVANANPIVLDSNGYPASGGSVVSIWLTSGVSYKFVLKTSASVTVWTRDNITGINDTSVSIDQWVSGATPTYVSATTFTLVGDQTTTYAPGRRLKFTVTAGTVYGTIYTSTYGALTTIVMAMDSSGNLDSGLSAVSYALLSSTDPSLPSVAQQTIASAATVNLASARGKTLHISGNTGPITSFGNAPSGLGRTIVYDSTPTVTYNATSMILLSGASRTMVAGDVQVMESEGGGNWRELAFFRLGELPLVIPHAAVYQWTAWDPSDVAGTPTNAPATAASTITATSYITMANSSGTVTFTFVKAGNYVVNLFGLNEMAAAPTGSTFLAAALGGTATRSVAATSVRLLFGNGTFFYGSMSGSASFSVVATANQTLTVLPSMTATSGGVTTNFTTECVASATYVGT